jgi:hypothetical protein
MTAQASRRAVIGGSHSSWTALQRLAPELAAHFFESTDAANQKLIEIEVCPTLPVVTGKNTGNSVKYNGRWAYLGQSQAACPD